MENQRLPQSSEASGEVGSSVENEESRNSSISRHSLDKEAGFPSCRVCQCSESDKRGVAALGFLGIIPPAPDAYSSNGEAKLDCHEVVKNDENVSFNRSSGKGSALVEFISPKGEVFVCNGDIEMGYDENQDSLNELGCACKNDLAMVHYACALKWFINHGSTMCEICGCVAKNIRISDFKKVVSSLKEYDALRERTANGEPNPAPALENSTVDPDAIAAIRRQRLSEIALWFNPHNHYSTAVSQVVSEPPSGSNIVPEEALPAENTVTKWAVEGTGILLATGLLTITLAWLIAPHVGKRTAKNGLHILLGGVCALTVVVFFRFFVLTRIKYGPARYWAILFVFWFLVFGIWASRTHGAHAT
ncbi:uncharacterized protein LOC107761242 isoform X1 [Nicotiana tabacum]|uniref:Uncharacterized protein LOC107761242 isoform X1 n=2 Tax=Nicotiana TaxID=4085 RepID=A0A1S3X5D9_TOBAC|nr:PREDICTED: uncharacterized protein LOC104243514 isoform X1 [Nicotiana sylvestris]XP_009797018.1 PREDICTED: uncharacterized protein LOC104243514 isoform X1 [Nicotiana sylvestris]XP_016434928.1 PREDICTED: uncharacterized protein LOC107761242 isoform X1 [Nicotiana tabacum]